MTKISEPIKEVIKKYSDIFECPTILPPSRNRNHFIYTIEGAKPVSVRPYRSSIVSEGRNGKSGKRDDKSRDSPDKH